MWEGSKRGQSSQCKKLCLRWTSAWVRSINSCALSMHIKHAAHDSPKKIAVQRFLLNVTYSCGMHTAYCKAGILSCHRQPVDAKAPLTASPMAETKILCSSSSLQGSFWSSSVMMPPVGKMPRNCGGNGRGQLHCLYSRSQHDHQQKRGHQHDHQRK